MPNLIETLSLRDKFSNSVSFNSKVKERELRMFSENYNKGKDQLIKAFEPQKLNSNIITYFEERKEAHVIILFIDITSFSNKASIMTNKQLSDYLDYYYDRTIPIIYKFGGEIEKIIGDGIIAVFGQPFLDDTLQGLLDKADSCAKEIIVEHSTSHWEVKIAFHDGIIQYYKNKNIMLEYTMIGQPLTDLFRLESIAISNAINYYCTSGYDNKFKDNFIYTFTKDKVRIWKRSTKKEVSFKGVNYNFIRYFDITEKTFKYIGDYDFEKGVERLSQTIAKKEILLESKIEDLCVDAIDSEAKYVTVTVLAISFISGDDDKIMKLLIQKSVLPELIKIIKSCSTYFDFIQHSDSFIGIFNTPYKDNIDEVFSIAAKISSMFIIIKEKFINQGFNELKYCIGIEYGEVLMGAIAGVNAGAHEKLFRGKIISRVVELSKNESDKIVVSSSLFSNLNDYNKSLLQKNSYHNYYYGSIVNIAISDWHKRQ